MKRKGKGKKNIEEVVRKECTVFTYGFGRLEETNSKISTTEILEIYRGDGNSLEEGDYTTLKWKPSAETYGKGDIENLLKNFESVKNRFSKNSSCDYAVCIANFELQGAENCLLPDNLIDTVLDSIEKHFSSVDEKEKRRVERPNNIIMPLLIRGRTAGDTPGHWMCIIVSQESETILFFDPHRKESCLISSSKQQYNEAEIERLIKKKIEGSLNASEEEKLNKINEEAEQETRVEHSNEVEILMETESYYFTKIRSSIEKSELIKKKKYVLRINEWNYQAKKGRGGLTECGVLVTEFAIKSIETILWREKTDDFDKEIINMLLRDRRFCIYREVIQSVSPEVRKALCHSLLDKISEKEFRVIHKLSIYYPGIEEYVSKFEGKAPNDGHMEGYLRIISNISNSALEAESARYLALLQSLHQIICNVANQSFAKEDFLIQNIAEIQAPQEVQKADAFLNKIAQILKENNQGHANEAPQFNNQYGFSGGGTANLAREDASNIEEIPSNGSFVVLDQKSGRSEKQSLFKVLFDRIANICKVIWQSLVGIICDAGTPTNKNKGEAPNIARGFGFQAHRKEQRQLPGGTEGKK